MSLRLNARSALRATMCLSVLTLASVAAVPAFATSTEYMADNCGISAAAFYDGTGCSGGLMYAYHPDFIGANASLVGNVVNDSGHAQTVSPSHIINFDSTLRNANASQTES